MRRRTATAIPLPGERPTRHRVIQVGTALVRKLCSRIVFTAPPRMAQSDQPVYRADGPHRHRSAGPLSDEGFVQAGGLRDDEPQGHLAARRHIAHVIFDSIEGFVDQRDTGKIAGGKGPARR